MTILISAIAFFILLTVLVMLHELGHFAVARWAKVTVEEFGFGLPPRIRTLFWQGGTRFSLNWIPFGGFVRLKGENAETNEERTAPGSFGAASFPARIAILVAGVFMNFLFAILLFTIGFSVGHWIPTYLTFEDMQAASERGEIHLAPGVLIQDVLPSGTALGAGVPARSLLLQVDGKDVYTPQEVSALQQGKEKVTYTFLPSIDAKEQQTLTVPVKEGKTGVGLQAFPRDLSAPSRSIGTAIWLSLRETVIMTQQTFIGLATLFVSLISTATIPEGITGVVGIAQLTHASVQEGFMMYLRLVALLSLSLAVLNILPLPALDGGRLLFVLLELVRGKPVNRRLEVMTNAIGFMALLLLIAVITYHDVLRVFWK
jgi:regulator of sigma E protease